MSRVPMPTDQSTSEGREFWRAVVLAGGRTAIPRWTERPVPGAAVHHEPLPERLLARLRRLAVEVDLPLRTIVLGAHARVLAALSGEPEVVTGYLCPDTGRPLPCRLTCRDATWRQLLEEVRRTEAALLAHRGYPVDELPGELGVDPPSYESVFDPTGAGDLADGTVLGVAVTETGGRPALVLRYRTDALDAACAARIAGYHATALRLMSADPAAGQQAQSLLCADELRYQIHGLAGPRRPRPDHRIHELFEHQVRVHPETTAVVQGTARLSYRELNARANRLGRLLLQRGLRREDVVAVVAERNLDWAVAVLAIFKAGGAYLPIEPHFPAHRIATMLTRAGCRLVLSDQDGSATLDDALSGLDEVDRLCVPTACSQAVGSHDLGVAVAADQLAYIFFTSGSTGEPKGAMCEHAGLLNHLYAKIEDLEISTGQVVAQTAPQCFDISLWQLLSALLVGGTTLIVEQPAILDAERFVDTIDHARVAVLQVVPSYLEAVLGYLERHPRDLPALRYVSVTGEALKKEITGRWFAAQPGVKLVNAYGLTETSDDTNHEVLTAPPHGDRVPLGRAIANVHVYVVDDRLQPVPLGAPGAIVFSGVCVGRGYVNDPERTRAAFGADPHRPGARLYRGGDNGRWLPDGKLEFLGRIDAQVKIRGFRIELGEIENTLLRVPGVRDCAVVVAPGLDQTPHLIGFYSAARPLDRDLLRNRLGQSLPDYMVPTALHWRPTLPVTPNGKIDTASLTALAAGPDRAEEQAPPTTPGERRLAAAWASVLGVPQAQVGRWDNFFDRGGTSLSAVKLAIALDRAVSLKDVNRHPVLADLATFIEDKGVS